LVANFVWKAYFGIPPAEEFPVERFDQIRKPGLDREPLAFQVVAEHSVQWM